VPADLRLVKEQSVDAFSQPEFMYHATFGESKPPIRNSQQFHTTKHKYSEDTQAALVQQFKIRRASSAKK
jgi:hypothetical protein